MRLKEIRHNYSLKLRNRKEYEIFRKNVYEKNNRNDLIYIDELNNFLNSYDNNFKSLLIEDLDIIEIFDENNNLIYDEDLIKKDTNKGVNEKIINSLQEQMTSLKKQIDKKDFEENERIRIENEIYFGELQMWVLKQDDIEYAYNKLWDDFKYFNNREYRMSKIFNSDLIRRLKCK